MSTEENKALVRRYTDGINRRDFSVIDALLAEGERQPERPSRRELVRRGIETFLGGFPDFQMTIEDMLAEGDEVATRFTCTATHTGVFVGIAPTGRHATWSAIEISRIVNGQFVQEWTVFDTFNLLQQIGAQLALSSATA